MKSSESELGLGSSCSNLVPEPTCLLISAKTRRLRGLALTKRHVGSGNEIAVVQLRWTRNSQLTGVRHNNEKKKKWFLFFFAHIKFADELRGGYKYSFFFHFILACWPFFYLKSSLEGYIVVSHHLLGLHFNSTPLYRKLSFISAGLIQLRKGLSL